MTKARWCRPALPRLIVISCVTLAGRDAMVRRIQQCCQRAQPGEVLVMLRDPELSVRERLDLGEQLRRLTRDTSQFLSVRDRLDLAMLLDADALHLSEGSPSGTTIRQVLGDRLLLTRAWHDLGRASPSDVDALLLSPVCASRKNQPAIGLVRLREYRSALAQSPIYALGGVTETNAAACLLNGASAVAVMGAVLMQDDCSRLLSELGILRS